jgi:hypothetical protein
MPPFTDAAHASPSRAYDAPVQLVVLAAGHGTRFGGLKQLAPVGPHGEALMDYTANTAASCGFDSIVVVVRDEIRDEIERHIRRRWPSELPVDLVCQAPLPGTAQAVLSAAPALDGPFGVANADDLYGEAALRAIHEHFSPPEGADSDDAHLLVGYRLVRTVLTEATVKRGLCEQTEDGRLLRVVEHTVQMRDDGSFDAKPLGAHGGATAEERLLDGSECVSMNLWGFHHRMLDHLDRAVAAQRSDGDDKELLLVDVVGDLVASGQDEFRVVATEARCLGVTHREDIAIVREQLALDEEALSPAETKAT